MQIGDRVQDPPETSSLRGDLPVDTARGSVEVLACAAVPSWLSSWAALLRCAVWAEP